MAGTGLRYADGVLALPVLYGLLGRCGCVAHSRRIFELMIEQARRRRDRRQIVLDGFKDGDLQEPLLLNQHCSRISQSAAVHTVETRGG